MTAADPTGDLFARCAPFEVGGSGATFSPCERYRYRLWRVWGAPQKRVLFVMLNPSTADDAKDDPTIRKCIGFAKRWGYGALDVVNLFAWRSTYPSVLLHANDPVGPDNDEMIAGAYTDAGAVVLAWGSHDKPQALFSLVARRADDVIETLSSLRRTHPRRVDCLGRASNLNPRHPLMLAYGTPLIDAASPAAARAAGGGR